MGRVLPILFNGDMVRAILDGRKTVTRRLIKPQPQGYFEVNEEPLYIYDTDFQQGRIMSPYQPGDILYVRETWNTYCEGCISKNLESVLGSTCAHACGENGNGYYYKATDKNHVRWRPSIHMPKEAARIWLKVKDVRVERLKEIDDRGCHAEGIEVSSLEPYFYELYEARFKVLWDSTIKKSDLDRYGWDANPWVLVIEFERCEKPEGWCV